MRNILIASDDYFADLQFEIESMEQTDKSYIITVAGLFNKQKVGFEIELNKAIPPGIVDNNIDPSKMKANMAFIRSTGKESNLFLSTLAELYKQDVKAIKMKKESAFYAFALSADKFQPETESLKIQLSYDPSNSEKLQTEFYITTNLKDGFIQFEEKHQIYRSNLIQILST
ncbi:MAG: hypothetical protein C0594_08310 [Marinilabiliales bacterium]|nr:MAG: hypothetical protein C0594_08310 [Marinilabiliales bacterium]